MMDVHYLKHYYGCSWRFPTKSERAWIEEATATDPVIFTALFYNQREIAEFILKLFGYRTTVLEVSPAYYSTSLFSETIDVVIRDKKDWRYSIEISNDEETTIDTLVFHNSIMGLSYMSKEDWQMNNYESLRHKNTVSIALIDSNLLAAGQKAHKKIRYYHDDVALRAWPEYVIGNLGYKGESYEALLYHDLQESNVQKIRLDIIRNRIDYLKNTREGRSELILIKDMRRSLKNLSSSIEQSN